MAEAPDLQVALWLWSLAEGDPAADDALLSPAEIRRRDRLVTPELRQGYAAGRAGLRRRLAALKGGAAPKGLDLRTRQGGKPMLRGGPAFNLSHSGGHALLAALPGRASPEIGVDLEQHRQIEPGLAARWFHPDELAWLDGLAPEGAVRGFFRLWTRKEAVLKAAGKGLTRPLAGFSVLEDSVTLPGLAAGAGDGEGAARFTLADLQVGRGYSAALAVAGRFTPVPDWR